MEKLATSKLRDSPYFVGLFATLFFIWKVFSEGLGHSWVYQGFPFYSQNYLKIHSITLIVFINIFMITYHYFSKEYRFRSLIISSIFSIIGLSTMEFYLNFNIQKVGFNPYFFILTFTFLILGYFNYSWNFLKIDPILMGLYLFVNGIQLVMWISKFFGLLTSLTFTIVLVALFIHLAKSLTRPNPNIELTL